MNHDLATNWLETCNVCDAQPARSDDPTGTCISCAAERATIDTWDWHADHDDYWSDTTGDIVSARLGRWTVAITGAECHTWVCDDDLDAMQAHLTMLDHYAPDDIADAYRLHLI